MFGLFHLWNLLSEIVVERWLVRMRKRVADVWLTELESENFRIDSTGWKVRTLEDGTRVKINPEGDVTEILGGDFDGEQRFTPAAALRETAKAGKRIPTVVEWYGIMSTIEPEIHERCMDVATVKEALRINDANFWAWSTTPLLHVMEFSGSQAVPKINDMSTLGCSVRCLKLNFETLGRSAA
ncbi:MAG: hypothetical protein KBF53_10855 [Sphingobium sp.]|jgi:hypothetical protein|nr:hypothetical protein [Sphingobium sp.]